jgi:hypothetical protein
LVDNALLPPSGFRWRKLCLHLENVSEKH